jgi:hypothetical protein
VHDSQQLQLRGWVCQEVLRLTLAVRTSIRINSETLEPKLPNNFSGIAYREASLHLFSSKFFPTHQGFKDTIGL